MAHICLGLDIGSTTVKLVAIPAAPSFSSAAAPHVAASDVRLVFKQYVKHRSDIKAAVSAILHEADSVLQGARVTIGVTGSGGINVARSLSVGFLQEVIACTAAVETLAPATDVAVELGGEDAKITYFGTQLEQRMNGTCAGGTGSFIDHMAALLKTDAAGLDALAAAHTMVYPIASRCGVFAKTDVQPLLNEGARREDVAVSVLQAVVNQVIGGLACGKPIRGRVAFLGGPLHFLPQLRARFVETLHLKPEETIVPEDAHFFVAIGAALLARNDEPVPWDGLRARIPEVMLIPREDSRLPPMFATEPEFTAFLERHARHRVPRADLATAMGDLFLGIDSGSTTTKIALIDDQGRLLHSYYGPNLGDPLKSTTQALLEMYARLPAGTHIGRSCVTGYGEGLVRAALHVDDGEIETLAHFKAADMFLPNVDFVIDIGGQDMKSMHIRNGAIDSIMLNEACSSGCGSFISTFAESLGMPVQAFALAGIHSQAPVDLGSRCTVFMNSRVKQAQKEGASVSDISGGIAISVIKNALFKVIRLRSAAEMGERIVVQGGTFANDAVLRAFELISGRQAIRPDIPGLMGAFGAAIIARENFARLHVASTLLAADVMSSFVCKTHTQRCGRCPNNCLLTINEFPDGGAFVSGNRCERGAALEKVKRTSSPATSASASASASAATAEPLPNLYTWKARRVFRYPPLAPSKATRGNIGIPRVLNMYEDYPLWHTIFTRLGFRVLVSAPTTHALFEMGMESIPSDTVCYPAKLVHGAIEDLARRGVRKIFLPCILLNVHEDPLQQNVYNCPVVGGYPEVARVNCDSHGNTIEFITPFLPLAPSSRLARRLFEEIAARHLGEDAGAQPITLQQVEEAVAAGKAAMEEYTAELRAQGEAALRAMDERGVRGVVFLGRPYHCDPEVNHGIPEIVASHGVVVLSEDSIAHLGRRVPRKNLRVVNQWTYHARLFAAAEFAVTRQDLDVLQLVSFGCGLDAVTSDQVKELVEGNGRMYTQIKIDEISNLGAARIRIRSMLAAISERTRKEPRPLLLLSAESEAAATATSCPTASCSSMAAVVPYEDVWPEFPANAREEGWTVLIPSFSGFHMECLLGALRSLRFRGVLLGQITQACIDEGVKYVQNDACYPAICVIGQMILALKSGQCNLDKTAVIITQTGGCCRATNYVAFLKKALRDAGFRNVPVISVNAIGLNPQPGWKLTLEVVIRCLMATLYGDLFMALVYRTRPYEEEAGSAMALYRRFEAEAAQSIVEGNRRDFLRIIRSAVQAFDQLPLKPEGDGLGNGRRPRVGIVGEILVKLNDDANNHLAEFLESEGAEATTHGLCDFFLYCVWDDVTRYKLLAGSFGGLVSSHVVVAFIEAVRSGLAEAMRHSRRFHPPPPFKALAELTSHYVSLANQSGEGWFLVGEILSMLAEGTTDVLLLQPAFCLPNHITGRGMTRLLRDSFPELNIAAIDYDPGASQVNQINRIKLMLTVAKRKISIATTPRLLGVSATPGPSGDPPAVAITPALCRTATTPSRDIEDAVGTSATPELCRSCSASCSSRLAPVTAATSPQPPPAINPSHARRAMLERTIANEHQWWITHFLMLVIVDSILAFCAIRRMFFSAAHVVSTRAGDAASEVTALLGMDEEGIRRRRLRAHVPATAIMASVMVVSLLAFATQL